jgi:hypothetical protein
MILLAEIPKPINFMGNSPGALLTADDVIGNKDFSNKVVM